MTSLVVVLLFIDGWGVPKGLDILLQANRIPNYNKFPKSNNESLLAFEIPCFCGKFIIATEVQKQRQKTELILNPSYYLPGSK